MRANSGTVPPTAWARQRERSNLWAMRLMRWIAVTAGRRAARLMLHPIVCGYCLGRATREHSARYLSRALGRPATWGDVYTHLFTFSAMVLDRVYLLQERFDEFTFTASGVEAMHRRLAEGRETLAALAPRAKLHTIGLGRVDAMLAIRRWLDEGGIAGLLADRTLPGNSQRSKSIVLPFLGAPAVFSDGPFRLAAILRQKVIFMAGLYRGGREYDLRFIEIADFGANAEAPAPGGRDLAIRAALERYVATLESLCREAPYNWFNFYDFWADADASPADAASR